MKTIAALLVEHLRKFGIHHVFGIPGRAVEPLVGEFDKQGVQFVLCRHETGAGFAASGYALTNRRLGVAVSAAGPGGMNMLTAAAQAQIMNLPVLFITGHPALAEMRRTFGLDASYLEGNLVKMFEPVTMFSARVERGELFPLYFKHALEKTLLGGGGPVHLNIPADVLTETVADFEIDFPSFPPNVSVGLEKIVPMLMEARTPVLFLGKGVNIAGAYEEVQILAQRLNIPVITSPGGKGAFPNRDIHYLGTFGLGGTEQATAIFRDGIDLMIIVGDSVSDMSASAMTPNIYPKQVIHFDYDATFVGKALPVPTIPVIGDIKENLRRLLDKVEPEESFHLKLRSMRLSSNTEETDQESSLLTAAKTFKILRQHLPADTVAFGDAGSNTFYAVKYFDILEPGTFHFDENFITMGHGIGFSIGAKFANPAKKVLCITGDGCTFMHGTEISTAVCNNLSIIFVVINNGRLDMPEKAMKYLVGHVVGAVFERPLDVTMFARSLGAFAICCKNERELEAGIKSALEHEGPVVLEAVVDPEEIPPTLSRERN